ncbi:YrzE family protein [Luteimonas fraxinea]|uniref:YrzE family protein n=1 Tax=Luteimonas fraxinea TaxID=2901869 RepID=UPI001E36E1AF|nr:YrzE family protein [Luteimonas fraxinea]MCD9124928.1 hypothetical protein [Luteimonas fraxinea]
MTLVATAEHYDARRASWGSIIGGVVTVLAVSILLSLLTTALGFGVADPMSSDPLDGVGAAFGIGSAITLLIALAAGGFVAGRLAGRSGMAHGFLVWATSLIFAAVLASMAIGGTARLAGSAIGGVFSAAGSVASAAGSAAGGAASGLGSVAERIGAELDIDTELDGERIEQNVADVLRDTGAESLQPEYLRSQLEGARDDAGRAVRRLASNPNEFSAITDELTAALRTRVEAVGKDVDREAVVKALVENTDMTRAEAETEADRLIARFEETRRTASERLAALETRVEEARQQMTEFEAKAREQADKATDAIARSALWAFFALLLGAAASAGAGLLGSRTRLREDTVVHTRSTTPRV